MERHVVPELPLRQLKRISPSKYLALKSCILREVWSADPKIQSLLPAAPIIKVGTITHKILELTVKGCVKSDKEAIEQWNREVDIIQTDMNSKWIEKHLLPLSKTARYYEVKRQQCLIMVHNLLEKAGMNEIVRPATTKVEVWVESVDGKVAGKIDLVRQTARGIEIIDYKTGDINDVNAGNNVIKQEYQQQLKMYAALYYNKFGCWPEHTFIVTLGRKEFEIPFTQKECIDLLQEAAGKLDEVNALIAQAKYSIDISNPSPDNCRYCSYRPACNAYKNARDNSGLWPIDCLGKLIDKKVLDNGSLRVTIDDRSTKMVIRGLNPKRHDLYCQSEIVGFYNLTHDSVSGYYLENPLTTYYTE